MVQQSSNSTKANPQTNSSPCSSRSNLRNIYRSPLSPLEELTKFALQFEAAITNSYSEFWWQEYLNKNLPLLLTGYSHHFSKINIGIGKTRFPDFILRTTDGYLNILEIKTPDTPLLKFHKGRGLYCWCDELAIAISQVQMYLSHIQHSSGEVVKYIHQKYHLESKIIHPIGIVLAGNAEYFPAERKDFFRENSNSIPTIRIITYDGLLMGLKHQIKLLEEIGKRTAK